MKPLPEALSELIETRGLSKTEVWAAAGINSGTLTRWTTGERGREFSLKSLETLQKLSDALDVPLTYWREYRLHQIGLAFRDHPELDSAFYDQIMDLANKLEVEPKRDRGGAKRRRSRRSSEDGSETKQ